MHIIWNEGFESDNLGKMWIDILTYGEKDALCKKVYDLFIYRLLMRSTKWSKKRNDFISMYVVFVDA